MKSDLTTAGIPEERVATGLPLVGLAALFLAGCGHTFALPSGPAPQRHALNGTAEICLTSGDTERGPFLEVRPDSVLWRSSAFPHSRSVALEEVDRIRVVNHTRGAKDGLRIGLMVAGAAMIGGFMDPPDWFGTPMSPLQGGAFFGIIYGVPAGVVGPIVGAVIGHRDVLLRPGTQRPNPCFAGREETGRSSPGSARRP